MKVAVLGLIRQGALDADVAALIEATARACDVGADVIVVPTPAWFTTVGLQELDASARLVEACGDAHFSGVPNGNVDSVVAPDARRSGLTFERTPLGMTATLFGDECLDPASARELYAAAPDAVILRPGCESEFQVEAMIERALALSESVAGMVIVAEADGAAAGEPGHGGSAIAVLGELVAEAAHGDDFVIAQVDAVPVPAPEPRDPLPGLPPILEQRLARHRGQHVRVSYLADA